MRMKLRVIMNIYIQALLTIALAFMAYKLETLVVLDVDFKDIYLVYVYYFILILLTPTFIKIFKKDAFTNYLRKEYKNPVLMVLWWMGMIIGTIVILNNNWSLYTILILAYGLFSVLYVFENRIAAIISVALLVDSAILHIINQIADSMQIATYAYIFMIIMIVTQIREYRLNQLYKHE